MVLVKYVEHLSQKIIYQCMNMCGDTPLYASSLTVLNVLSKKHLDTFIYMLPKIPSGKYINIK